MHLPNLRWYTVLIGYLVTHVKAYPVQAWYPPQGPREYPDDEYYYAPKVQYYYDAPAISVPEVYGQMPYPYVYDPYEHFFANDGPKRQEERLAALPIGQETWFENDANSRWRSSDVDDVSAAFLDNLILTQMAQDAQRRRENSRAAFPPVDYEDKNTEDEDVRELKALAGQPLYHVPKTVPKVDDYDYASDEGFINWNGNKRSLTTSAPTLSTVDPKLGQKEVAIPPQGQTTKHASHFNMGHKRETGYYDKIVKLLAANTKDTFTKESTKERRIDKRFVAGDSDLVLELRGLKQRIAT
ncbi:uncharacterized protein LOC128676340 [Plodia interpunctella]|uniref:uncharacterized protein LOC128676340 n=1 Tax=Plodia interpunctella TaxID=58824 RepID=UPI002367CF20|nr:uncharacterized protein LOC128676340 [Plodia interpunctella]